MLFNLVISFLFQITFDAYLITVTSFLRHYGCVLYFVLESG